MSLLNEETPFAVMYRFGTTPSDSYVSSTLSVLNQVPLVFRRTLHGEGMRITYFNGPCTLLPELKHIAALAQRTVEAHGVEDYVYEKMKSFVIDEDDLKEPHIRNFPFVKLGDIYIGVNGGYMDFNNTPETTMLHEAGHSIDFIVGQELYQQRISSTEEFRRARANIWPKVSDLEAFAFLTSFLYRLEEVEIDQKVLLFFEELEKKLERHLVG